MNMTSDKPNNTLSFKDILKEEAEQSRNKKELAKIIRTVDYSNDIIVKYPIEGKPSVGDLIVFTDSYEDLYYIGQKAKIIEEGKSEFAVEFTDGGTLAWVSPSVFRAVATMNWDKRKIKKWEKEYSI